MKFSENWLRTYANPPISTEQLAHELTMAGLEVEAIEPVAPPFNDIVVGHIVEVTPHPNADRLRVCRVDVGRGEPLQIVCGAANAAAGMKVPCALAGAVLPGGLQIKEAQLRGVPSSGMLCSAKELGLAEESSGLLPLSPQAAPGLSVRVLLELDDRLFTLKLTPNRADCLSVMGIAREVAAITHCPLHLNEVEPTPETHRGMLPVRVPAADACPRYLARVVTGVDLSRPTPEWMVQRLERCGLRSINAVVDITNYLLLKRGQPLHAFDLAQLHDHIEVRFALAGETLELLNGQQVALEPDMLVIADAKGPVALAGIMGGAKSAVSSSTTDIVLESAFFSPGAIAGRSRKLGFSSDSSYRFERGVDFGNTRLVMERATQLVLNICGGQAGPITEILGNLPERNAITLRRARLNRLLGMNFSAAEVRQLLQRLRAEFSDDGEVYTVTPPSYRFDWVIEEDLVEEIARLHGYDNVPAPLPVNAQAMLPQPEQRLTVAALKQRLVARDYQEIITYSFVEEAWERDFAGNPQPLRLLNPIASQMSVMRSSLVGSLIECLRYNLGHKQNRVRLFEIGACYRSENGQIVQPERLGGLCYGDVLPEQWGSAARPADFFDVKGDITALLADDLLWQPLQDHPALHPGRAANILRHGQVVGWLGELHPRWMQRYALPRAPLLFELEVAALLPQALPQFQSYSRLPAIRRDIAVLIDDAVPLQRLLDAMQLARSPLVTEIALFDLYRGENLEQGKKSLAFRVLLQDTEKNLTDEEADAAVQQLIEALQQHGGRLRDC